MSGSTAKYGVPYITDDDTLANTDETSLAVATRVDLLLGETGTDSITPSAADTDTTKRINYARSYAALAPLIPKVLVLPDATVSSGTTVHWFISGEDATGFTVHIRKSTTSAQAFRWFCRAG